MNTFTHRLVMASMLALSAPIAWSHGTEQHKASMIEAGRTTAKASVSIPMAANDAVAALERFSNALAAGDLPAASQELSPTVLILESGGAERSRDEYLNGHAKHDAEFLKSAQITLNRRTASVSGDLVWVASESQIHAMKGDQMLKILSTETAVLQKVGKSWQIVHLHWSSRAQK